MPVRTAILAALALAAAPAVVRAQAPSGEQLYKQHCVRCHGADGQGAKKSIAPLAGEKSIAQLAKVIDDTMPENDPDLLNAAESARVAEYIHGAFYSPTAQARVRPARIDLARLTVGQYRNAVADIVAGFRPVVKHNTTQGLRGEYFNARNFQQNKRVIDRLDPEVKFDFGKAAPAGAAFDAPHTFAIRWDGSVIPPDSGVYEFVVRTEHAVKLFVNDNKTPLIDAWVKSGKDTEFRGSVHLLAGRAVPIRLEFSKAKQGVDDSKKNPNPPLLPASIALLWKPPHRALDVIPGRHLTPTRAPESYVVTAAFPPDDRSLGWERGTTVSKEWDAATTEAALDAVNYVAARLNELAGTTDTAGDRAAKLKAFAVKFAERAFRRPLTPEQRATYIDAAFAAGDPDLAVKRVVLLVLKSPRFLYREVNGPNDGYAVAARLAFTLWDSGPDDELLKAAAENRLATPAQVQAQAERMLADPRARTKIRQFLMTWLRVDQPPDVTRNPQRFPGFDDLAVNDLRASLELMLDEVVWSPESDFRRLFLADTVPLNDRLAGLYGADKPAGSGFAPVRLDGGSRRGVLTHPYLMATFAYTSESAPVHRGVFLARGVLGLRLRPPQDAFAPFAPELHPNLTTRERTALQTRPAGCMTCHAVINPLGFVLENYDAIGRFRDRENGKPVDASGTYHDRAGRDQTFRGPADLAAFAAASPEVRVSFAEQLFHHLAKQPTRAYGRSTPEDLGAALAADGYNVRKLIVRAAILAALPPTGIQTEIRNSKSELDRPPPAAPGLRISQFGFARIHAQPGAY